MRQIRPAKSGDLEAILVLIDEARAIMRSDGNLTQWAGGYPDAAAILKDIDRQVGYLILDDGVPSGYFALIPGPDPTYAVIEGRWTDDDEYYVIHRIASGSGSRGIMSSLLDFSFASCDTIRIDTHEDNRIMQHILLKAGFAYCGIIHLMDGAPRLAYLGKRR